MSENKDKINVKKRRYSVTPDKPASAGWMRDTEGNLLMPQNSKVKLQRGWAIGLSDYEKELVHQHNKNIDVMLQHQKFKEQNEKAGKLTHAQRVSVAANKLSQQLVNEIEAQPLDPIYTNDAKGIKMSKDRISRFMDMIKLHKSLLDHRDLIAEESGEQIDASGDGVTNIADVRKKMKEIKSQQNGSSEE